MKKKGRIIVAAFIAVLFIAVTGYILISDDNHQAGEARLSAQVKNPSGGLPDGGDKTATPARKHISRSPSDFSKMTTAQTEPLFDKNLNLKQQLRALYSYRKNPSLDVIHTLSSFLNHGNRVLASEAIDTLGYLALNSDEYRETVLNILKAKAEDQSYALRDKALYMAAMIGKDEMLPVVGDYINNPDESTHADDYDVASRALAIIRSQECVPYLSTLLAKVKDSEVLRNCFVTLTKIDSPEALSILKQYVQSAQGTNQIAGADALARLQRTDVTDFLCESIQAQRFAPETIDRLSLSPTAPDIFGRLLGSEAFSKEQKIDFLNTLAEYSPEGDADLRAKMTSVMVTLLEESETPEIKARAIKVIGELGERSAPEIIQSYLKADNPDIRKEAFLNFVGYTNPSNYASLYDFIWDEDKNIRRTAMISLERFAARDDIEILQKIAQHEDEFIRNHANVLLDQLGKKESS